MLIKETTVLLLLFAMITLCQSDGLANDTQPQVQGQTNQQQLEQQLDQERVEEVNFVINSYFQNCQIDQESQVLYNCSMPKQNYAEFLYALFHKQMIRNFLKYYQLEGKLQKQTEIQEMYKVGQKVHQQVVDAYKDWILIYKPNPRIEVQEMYSDVVDLDANVLDVIEHDLQRHHDFVNVLKQIFKIKTDAKRYVVMGNKTSEQIAEDFAGLAKVYFGDCAPLADCKLSLSAFAFFVKQFSFYITPLDDELQGQQDILVSEEMDFEATQFLLQEVQKIKQILGQSVEYSELEQYSEKLAMSLFTHLKDRVQTREASREQKGEKINDKANASHQL